MLPRFRQFLAFAPFNLAHATLEADFKIENHLFCHELSEGAWKGINFLNPARDGAVLLILHLNGYKIAGPTVLGRELDEQIRHLLTGHGYEVHFVAGDEPMAVHEQLASTMQRASTARAALQYRVGPAMTRAASRISCSPAPATSQLRRLSPRRGCYASTCPK
ncbi:MAG TPA: hypothetical protein VIX59_15565 [Candidatus Binataceae bacterium]